MEENLVLSGTVESKDGEPLSGATKISLLRLDPDGTETEIAGAEVGAGQREFRLANAPPGTYVLHAQNPSMRPVKIPSLQIAEENNAPLNLFLEPGRVIRGRVT